MLIGFLKNKMKIAFCKFAGMGNGGIEKYLQTIALIYHKEHNIDYYYTNAAPFPCQSWQHPDNDEQRIKLFEDNGINLIKIQVGYRIKNDWYNTNFTDLFDENKYDYLITAGNGEPEYPYKTLKKIPIIHTVHGDHVFDQSNVKYYVLLCDWQAKRWIQNGGDASRLMIIPPIVYVPKSWNNNFRETIGIRGAYGTISNESRALNASGINYKAPENVYWEYNVGIGNIYKVFRIEFSWRGSYITPQTNNFGIKGSFGIFF